MKKTDAPKRARATAALLAGQTGTEAAAAAQVSTATVSRIKRDLSPETLQAIESKKDADFNELLATYLEEILETLTCQIRFARDPQWLREQTAAQLALLHGICADKAFRLLEARDRAQTITVNRES
jgi:hypothetical protein